MTVRSRITSALTMCIRDGRPRPPASPLGPALRPEPCVERMLDLEHLRDKIAPLTEEAGRQHEQPRRRSWYPGLPATVAQRPQDRLVRPLPVQPARVGSVGLVALRTHSDDIPLPRAATFTLRRGRHAGCP